jgi:hypothetical protein
MCHYPKYYNYYHKAFGIDCLIPMMRNSRTIQITVMCSFPFLITGHEPPGVICAGGQGCLDLGFFDTRDYGLQETLLMMTIGCPYWVSDNRPPTLGVGCFLERGEPKVFLLLK